MNCGNYCNIRLKGNRKIIEYFSYVILRTEHSEQSYHQK